MGSLQSLALPVLITLGKVGAFVAIMLIVGRRIIPWILHYVAHTGSRELFRLAVLAIALGVASGAAALFDVSFALGAFFAGMILSESELSQRAANETLPLRDAFAVLFFVSVGMLFDPDDRVAAAGAAAGDASHHRDRQVAGGLRHRAAVRSLALDRGHDFREPRADRRILFHPRGPWRFARMLPEHGRDLILAGAIVSIVLNPFCFAVLDRLTQRLREAGRCGPKAAREQARPRADPRTTLTDHIVLVGHGRVGSYVKASD